MNLIETLQEMYHRGANYVDLTGIEGEESDTLQISFSRAYMEEEFKEEFDSFANETEKDPSSAEVKLSDEDLNDLI